MANATEDKQNSKQDEKPAVDRNADRNPVGKTDEFGLLSPAGSTN